MRDQSPTDPARADLWSMRFTARRWRLLVTPPRAGVPRLRAASLRGPWLEITASSRVWRWCRGAAEVSCVAPRRAWWTRALPARMLLVAPRCNEGSAWAPDADADAAAARSVVFDCAGLSRADFDQLSRHVRLFTETAWLRDSALEPSLDGGRVWERLVPEFSRKVS